MNEEQNNSVPGYLAVEGFTEAGKGQGMQYFTVFDHSICKRSSSPVEGWDGPFETINPTTKEAVISYAKKFDSIIARIGGVEIEHKEFETGGRVTNWTLTLVTNTQEGPVKSGFRLTWCEHVLQRFLSVAPNIDFELPISINVWASKDNGKVKTAVAFRQPSPDKPQFWSDPKKWDNVPTYWMKSLNPDGTVNKTSPATGADGSVKPEPIYYEEDKSWDWRPQERFLGEYFKANVLPKIEAVGQQLGIESVQQSTLASPEFSGPAEAQAPAAIHVTNVQPANPTAQTLTDAVENTQIREIDRLLAELGRTGQGNAASQRLLGCMVHELSRDGAGYLIHRLREMTMKQTVNAPPVAVPPAQAPPQASPPSQFRQAVDQQAGVAAPQVDKADNWDAGLGGSPVPPSSDPFDPSFNKANANDGWDDSAF